MKNDRRGRGDAGDLQIFLYFGSSLLNLIGEVKSGMDKVSMQTSEEGEEKVGRRPFFEKSGEIRWN